LFIDDLIGRARIIIRWWPGIIKYKILDFYKLKESLASYYNVELYLSYSPDVGGV
jgi:hypothetical protein